MQQLENMAPQIVNARNQYEKFILKCSEKKYNFRLTPIADSSAFARCFGIFGLHLINSEHLQVYKNNGFARTIKVELDQYKNERESLGIDLALDKAYLQLLCFSLSALKIIGKLESFPLKNHVEALAKRDISKDLKACGSAIGKPSSGNIAMFMAIIRIHAQQALKIDTQDDLNFWINTHLQSMNCLGFWEQRNTNTFSQFQNGYHQHEIFEYLGIHGSFIRCAAEAVAELADKDGHFGPYPGGGGCYDYDATAIMLSCRRKTGTCDFDEALIKLAQKILNEQKADGGFADTLYFRPLNLQRAMNLLQHIVRGPVSSIPEKFISVLSYSRPKFANIPTHWSSYSRGWNESNLWDSWFRMLAVVRIYLELGDTNQTDWNFIDFPGIGFVQN